MKLLQRLIAFLLLSLLTSCELLDLRNIPITSAPVEDRVLPDRETHETLLEFAATLVSLPPEQQRNQCESIVTANRTNNNEGIYLRSGFAVMATPNCGNLNNALQQLQNASGGIKDGRFKNLITYQIAVLERLIRTDNDFAAQNLLNSQEMVTITQENAELEIKLTKAEAQLKQIQDKFDALKSIEKNLNRPTEEVITP